MYLVKFLAAFWFPASEACLTHPPHHLQTHRTPRNASSFSVARPSYCPWTTNQGTRNEDARGHMYVQVHSHTYMYTQRPATVGCQCQPPRCSCLSHTWAESTMLSLRQRRRLPAHTTIHTQESRMASGPPSGMPSTQMWCSFCSWASGPRAPLPTLVRCFVCWLGEEGNDVSSYTHCVQQCHTPQRPSPHSVGRE